MNIKSGVTVPRRRWLQFGMRTLLLVTILAGCVSLWIVVERKNGIKHRADIEAIRQLKREVSFDPQAYVRPEWLQFILGDNPAPRVTGVGLDYSIISDGTLDHVTGFRSLKELYLSGTPITDAGIKRLRGLTRLEYLWLSETAITDQGLAYLDGLSQLRSLKLRRTKISDLSIEQLKKFKHLKTLEIIGTPITDAGLAELKAALPECEILK